MSNRRINLPKASPTLFDFAWPAALLMLVAALIVWQFSIPWTWHGSLGWWSSLYGASFGVLLYVAVLLPSNYIFKNWPSIRRLYRQLTRLFKDITWPGIVLLSFLAGFGEELLFRVVLQGGLTPYLGDVAALVLASMVFGVMHFLSKAYVLMTFVLGLVLGMAYLWTQSYLLVAMAHFVYDICAFAVIVKYPDYLLDDPAKQSL